MSSIEIDTRFVFLGVFLLGAFIGLSVGVMAADVGNSPETVNNQQPGSNNGGSDSGGSPGAGGSEQVDMSDVSDEGEPVMGESDAPVTMYIYEDLECPFCKRFEQGAFPQIVSEYVDSGQVKLVWKDMPLTQLHPWAKDGAIAMECVFREGGSDAFWSTKDKVFNNQEVVNTGNVNDQIVRWASDNGVSESAVRSCIESGDATKEVDEDLSEGRGLGVSGTPTVFVNGQKVVGAQPFGQFQSVIESKLN